LLSCPCLDRSLKRLTKRYWLLYRCLC